MAFSIRLLSQLFFRFKQQILKLSRLKFQAYTEYNMGHFYHYLMYLFL